MKCSKGHKITNDKGRTEDCIVCWSFKGLKGIAEWPNHIPKPKPKPKPKRKQ